MVALFFHFSKRQNSTKRPNDGDGTEMSISIRGNVPSGQLSSTSGTEYYDTHPTIWVSGNSNYNYVKMPGSNRYYFVRDRQREINDATVYYLEEDYLATWADEIKGSTQKVIYSASNYNPNIDDTRNVETESTSLAANTAGFPFTLSSGKGSFLVTITGMNAMATTYVLSEETMESAMSFLNDSIETEITEIAREWSMKRRATIAQDITDIVDALKLIALSLGDTLTEQLTNAFTAIKDVKWSPIAPSVLSNGNQNLTFNTYNTYKGFPTASGLLETNTTINVPHQGSNYQKCDRFSAYNIYIPFCGTFTIPATDLYNVGSVNVKMVIDRATCDISGSITPSDSSRILVTFGGCASASRIYSTQSMSYTGQYVTQAGVTIRNLMMNLGKIGGMAGVQSNSGGTLASAVGGFANGYPPTLLFMSVMKGMADSQTAIKDVCGLPLHKTVALSTLSGYVLCNQPSVEMQGMLSEKEKVLEYLEKGCFLE